jgi:hypothetical protein
MTCATSALGQWSPRKVQSMARQEIKTYKYIDDLSGEEIPEDEAQTIGFTYAGTSYEIDLGKENAQRLDELMAEYIDKARKVRAGSTTRVVRVKESRDLNKIRAWAEKNGHGNHPRRIPKDVLEAYEKAH